MSFTSSLPANLLHLRSWAYVWVLLLLLLLLVGEARAQLDNETSPTSQFKSRPDLHPPIIDFSILRPELVTPGYIFLAPYRNVDPGPYIYDNWGNLVWSGAGSSGPKTAHTPRVCQYKGTDHLCYFQGEQHQGFARGHGVIMDNNYRIVRTVESSGAGASSDMHEFKMTPFSNGTTALMTVYQPRQYDLTTNPRFNVERGMGWIVEGVFQEVVVDTGRVVFEWRSLDHVDPGLSWTMPGTTDTSGDGLHEQSPWDYFHINSIDKNADGDYLISARHVSAIYKLSGQDGKIMWQMGGTAATIRTTNFVFSYQHHARWVSENGTHTVMSFYDNASNSYNQTGNFSHGWIVSIDHAAATATMIKEWGAPEPEGGILSGSQGNMQLLPGGNVHIGWGEHAYFTEHTADGSAVMYAKLASRPSNVMIYRSNKYNWTATPLTQPALHTYSKDRGRMAFWVSWNGATEVRSWNFYTGHTPGGPWTNVGNRTKDGFETEFHTANVTDWAYAEAVDATGRVLAESVVQRTFVPGPKLVEFCNDRGCDRSSLVPEDHQIPYDADVRVDEHFLSPNRGFNTSDYYQELPPGSSGAHSTSSPKKSNDAVNLAVVLAALGLLVAFGAGCFAYFLFTRGALRSLEPVVESVQRATSEVRAALGGGAGATSSSSASKVLGKYAKIREKEMEGSESGSSFSSSSSGSGSGGRGRI